MQVHENTITFDYVKKFDSTDVEGNNNDQRVLIVVSFDGEGEFWTTHPSNLENAKQELTEYYQHDWKGTNRILPMYVYGLADYSVIHCL